MGVFVSLPLPFSLHTSNTYFTSNVAGQQLSVGVYHSQHTPTSELLVVPLTQLHLGMEGHSLSPLGRVGDD